MSCQVATGGTARTGETDTLAYMPDPHRPPRPTRRSSRKAWVIGAVLAVAGVIGLVTVMATLTQPGPPTGSAHADPALTSTDQALLRVLTHAPGGIGSESRGQAMGIYPGPGLTTSDIVSLAHQVVADVRAGSPLDQEANSLSGSGKLSNTHAQYFAVAAIVVYGPELRCQIHHTQPYQGYYYDIWHMVYGGMAPSPYDGCTVTINP